MADARVAEPTSVDQGSWKTRDFIVAAAIAVPLGVVWSLGWGYVWSAGRSILPELGFVLDGFYVVAAVIVGYIVRRPGAALLGEMLASSLEIPLTPFGAIVLWLGLLQGLGVEAVFASTRYRRWSLPILLLAGAAGAIVPYFGYTYFTSSVASLGIEIQALRLVLKLIGGAIFAGLIGKLIADALARTGVLNNFPIARDRVREV
ncbi:MAG: ECF transporter S component [Chloroflexi bacterium]|nr:ECF transporter S component [Chloroflexota bacterium]